MKKKVSEMSEKELMDLIDYMTFKTSRRANEQLFKGLIKFVNQLMDDNRMILEELEQIKRTLHTREEDKQKVVEIEEDEKSSFSKMQSKLKPEDLAEISEVSKNLKLNHELPVLKPHLPTPQIPNFKGR